jgi:hypothetical protein
VKIYQLISMSILALIPFVLYADKNENVSKKNTKDYEIVGEYTDSTSWRWKVAVIKKYESKEGLIEIAKQIFEAYPKQRIHLFDDKERVKLFIDRQNYVNDKSGRAKEVPYDGEWVNKHHVANINDRSSISTKTGVWQLTTSEYSEHIAYIDQNTPPIADSPSIPYKGNTIENAHTLCGVFNQGGLLSEPCSVHGWGQYVKLSIDTSAYEAKALCDTVVEQLRNYNTHFNNGWSIKIFSPFSNGQTIATCNLPN